jgi:hypothetical protein
VIVRQGEQHGVLGGGVDAKSPEQISGSFDRKIDDDGIEAASFYASENVLDAYTLFRSDSDGIEAAPEHERAEVVSGGDESSDFHNPGIIPLGKGMVETRKFIAAN